MESFTQRLFFALWPDDAVRTKLTAALRLLTPQVSARWIRPENLHMTLVFLGDVETERLEAVKAAADAVRAQSFELRLDRIDYWRRPQVICLTPSAVCEPLEELATGLSLRLRSEGFDLEKRPFRAHLTLARKAPRLPADCRLEKSIIWKSTSFALVESSQDNRGSHYTILHSWPLGGEAVAPPNGTA